MQTTPIHNQVLSTTAVKTASSVGSDSLLDEFSKTLDQIASKLKPTGTSFYSSPVTVATPAPQMKVKSDLNLKSTKISVQKPEKSQDSPVNTNSAQSSQIPKPTPKTDNSEKPEKEATPSAPKAKTPSQETPKVQNSQDPKPEPRAATDQAQVSQAAVQTQQSMSPAPASSGQKTTSDTTGTSDEEVSNQQVSDQQSADEGIDDSAASNDASSAANQSGGETTTASSQSDASNAQTSAEAPAQVAPSSSPPLPTSKENSDTAPVQANTAQPVEESKTAKTAAPDTQIAAAEATQRSADLAQSKSAPVVEPQATQITSENLAQSIENIIQNKMLDTNSPPVAALQSTSQIESAAPVVQEAQSVIAQLSQIISTAALKGVALAQPQAQGLQISDMSAFKQADSSHGSDAPKGEVVTLPKPQAARTMEKVENALKEVSKSKDGRTISVRLDPPDLGTVKVDMTYRDGDIHARISADERSVTHLLKEGTPELVAMIRKLGLNVDKVTVTVSSSSEQNSENLGSFESFKQGSGEGQAKGQQSGRKFGVEQGSLEQNLKQQTTDDHWIA